MKKEKLNKVLKKFQVECLNYGWDSLLDAILESVAPEPLDPHTCELMVGDEVFIYGVSHIVISITPKCANAPTLYELIDRRPNSIYLGRYKSILITKRKLLKLISRTGATIKEVGNE